MSWLSSFVHNPGEFITHDPLKALALLAGPLALGFGGAGLLGALGGGLGGAGGAAAGAAGAAGAAEGLGAAGLGGANLAELAGGIGSLGGAGAAGAAGGAGALGAGGLGALDAFAAAPGALSFTADGLPFATAGAEGLGAAGTGITVNALGGAGAAAGGGGILEGLGGALSGGLGALGNFLMPSANASPVAGPGVSSSLSPNDYVGQGFDAVNQGIGSGQIDPIGANNLGGPGGTSASSFAPPAGVSPQVDPTSLGNLGGTGGVETGAAPTGSGASLDNLAATGNLGGNLPPTNISAAATNATPGAGGGSSSGFSLQNLLKGAGDSVMKNPLGLGLAAGGLGYTVLNGQQQSGAVKNIQGQADQLGAQGAQLRSYLESGKLPGGLQASLDQATKSAKARAISNAAAQGLPTDPTRNTALASTLAEIDRQATAQSGQIAQQLLTTGVNESGLANQLYTTLANIDQSQSQSIGKAIASMAAALSGGGPKIQIGGTANA